jgi:hypothetical protein
VSIDEKIFAGLLCIAGAILLDVGLAMTGLVVLTLGLALFVFLSDLR